MKYFARFFTLFAGVSLIFAISGTATAAEPAQTITVKAGDTMRFDVTKIEAVAGTTIAIKLDNVGKLPKAAMGHNLVVLTKDANVAKFANAAMMARDAEYIPAAMSDQIVAYTKLLGPGESDTITFTVPSEPGNYIYLCSFPAHFMAGMRGTIVVSAP